MEQRREQYDDRHSCTRFPQRACTAVLHCLQRHFVQKHSHCYRHHRTDAQTTGLPVHCYLSGRLGGVQQITSRIACDEVDLVLFFRDPLKADAASITEQNLLRLCDMHSVPIATNIATAEVLLRGMDQGDLDYREGMHPALVEPMPTVQRHAV